MSISGSRDYYASALTQLSRRVCDDNVLRPTLDQARVTEMRAFDSFARLAEFVLSNLRYPYDQSHKFETYGWVPALYNETIRTFESGRSAKGIWRNGAAEADLLACFVADVDNHNSEQPMLTCDEFARRLSGAGRDGPAWFTYTSFSSKPDHPKFRVVIDTSRALTRAEAAGVFCWLNLHVLNQQGDSSIYDDGDYLYAPPCNTAWQVGGDQPLDVDAVLAEITADPALYATVQRTSRPQRAPARPLTPDQAVRLGEQMAVLIPAEGVSIDNPAVFNPAWTDDYRNCTGSHWETMRSILGRVWLKSGGTLTLGDMLTIGRQVDATAGLYFLTKYGESRLRDLVRFTMRQPVSPRPDPIVLPSTVAATRAARRLAHFTPRPF